MPQEMKLWPLDDECYLAAIGDSSFSEVQRSVPPLPPHLLADFVTLSRWMAPISQLCTGTAIQKLLIFLTLLVQSAAVVCANSKVCVSSVCKTWK